MIRGCSARRHRRGRQATSQTPPASRVTIERARARDAEKHIFAFHGKRRQSRASFWASSFVEFRAIVAGITGRLAAISPADVAHFRHATPTAKGSVTGSRLPPLRLPRSPCARRSMEWRGEDASSIPAPRWLNTNAPKRANEIIAVTPISRQILFDGNYGRSRSRARRMQNAPRG